MNGLIAILEDVWGLGVWFVMKWIYPTVARIGVWWLLFQWNYLFPSWMRRLRVYTEKRERIRAGHSTYW